MTEEEKEVFKGKHTVWKAGYWAKKDLQSQKKGVPKKGGKGISHS